MFVMLSLFLFLTTVQVSRTAPSAGCGAELPQIPHPGRHHRFNMTIEDPVLGPVERFYLLHMPASYSQDNAVPTPLVLSFHGWTGSAEGQMTESGWWRDVADIDSQGFIYVSPQGMDDNPDEGSWGSWNVSRTPGPLGMTCDTSNPSNQVTCYSSCDFCDKMTSCDWTSCYDDVVFTEMMVEEIASKFCIDTDSIHMSGASNGAMYLYSRILPRMAETLASIGPVCGAPELGFNNMPAVPLNIIDFHGLNDRTIPYNVEGPDNHGPGPHGTVESSEGWYYHQKPLLLQEIREWMNCSPDPEPYPTHMDGQHGWACLIWSGCDEGKEVVACTAEYTHDYPFHNRYIEGIKILWDFMKSHPKGQ